MRSLIFIAGIVSGLSLLCGCSGKESSTAYVVEGSVADSSANGKTVYIMRYDDNRLIDTAVVENNRFRFVGNVDTAAFCRIDITPQEFGNFILEPGNITVNLKNYKEPSEGTPLNAEMVCVAKAEDSIRTLLNLKREEYKARYVDNVEFQKQWELFRSGLQKEIEAKSAEFFGLHNDDAVGFYMMFTCFVKDLSLDVKLKTLRGFGPWLKSTVAARRLLDLTEAEKATSVGMPFVDVKGVDADGNTVSLSDCVGKGNYVLVDMWASWCAPCIGEIPYLAKLHQHYRDKGLTVVGVFIWDKPENLASAVQSNDVEWLQIVDTEQKALKNYGALGVPFIFLVSPDGTIVERDLRGDNMVTVVENYLSKN